MKKKIKNGYLVVYKYNEKDSDLHYDIVDNDMTFDEFIDSKSFKSNSGLLSFLNNDPIIVSVISIDKFHEVYHLSSNVLDDVEREYLSNLIKPFRDGVINIEKTSLFTSHDEEYICINLSSKYDGEDICLPCFAKGTMYKGMELDKEYSLEELGL